MFKISILCINKVIIKIQHLWNLINVDNYFLKLFPSKLFSFGTSLAVQWLGLHTFTAEGARSIPGWRTKIPQAV